MKWALKAALGRLVAGASSATFLTYLLALALGLILLTSTELGQDLRESQRFGLTLGAFFIWFRIPIGFNLLELFLGSLLIYGVCFATAFRDKGGFLTSLRSLLRGFSPGRLPHWLVVMPIVSSTLLLVVVAATALQDRLGLPTGSLFDESNPPPVHQVLAGLTVAPIIEEANFRISVLGLLVAARVIWSGRAGWIGSPSRRAALIGLSFLSPERAKSGAGLPYVADRGWHHGLHWTEWLLLLITSIAFGLAHLGPGSGWQIGKVTTASLAGLALGLAFLVYGAYAAILMHWFFNYYLGVFDAIPNLLDGTFAALNTLVGYLTIAVGLLGIGLALAWVVFQKLAPGTGRPQ